MRIRELLLFFTLVSSLVYSEGIDKLKSEVKKITNEIKEKNTRIERINV